MPTGARWSTEGRAGFIARTNDERDRTGRRAAQREAPDGAGLGSPGPHRTLAPRPGLQRGLGYGGRPPDTAQLGGLRRRRGCPVPYPMGSRGAAPRALLGLRMRTVSDTGGDPE